MEIRKLDETRIRQVYKERTSRDFPASELRSLKNLLSLLARGEYECLGLFEEAELMGYAFFICHGQDLLLDYFAVAAEYRDRGIGSEFLRQIAVYYAESDSLIAEIDDPDHTDDEQEKAHRLRRKAFYDRNGFRDTGARVKTFGVWFRLIECGKNVHDAEETRQIYARHYQQILPKTIYNRFIRF